MTEIYYSGQKLVIECFDGARESLAEAEAGVPGNQDACPAQLQRMIERLADVGRLMSKKQFRLEGDGIWAIKARCGLRAYGWYAEGHRFVISHFVLKRKDKMAPGDFKLAKDNRETYRRRRHDN